MCVCACVHALAVVYMRRAEYNEQELIISFYHIYSGDQTCIVNTITYGSISLAPSNFLLHVLLYML